MDIYFTVFQVYDCHLPCVSLLYADMRGVQGELATAQSQLRIATQENRDLRAALQALQDQMRGVSRGWLRWVFGVMWGQLRD